MWDKYNTFTVRMLSVGIRPFRPLVFFFCWMMSFSIWLMVSAFWGFGAAIYGIILILVKIITAVLKYLWAICVLIYRKLARKPTYSVRALTAGQQMAAPISADLIYDGYDYEKYVARCLAREGFVDIRKTKGSGDFGVDITAKDPMGRTYAIQCKYYTGSVGPDAIQQVYTGRLHYGCQNCIVITNSTFSKAARTLAKEAGVELWGNYIR